MCQAPFQALGHSTEPDKRPDKKGLNASDGRQTISKYKNTRMAMMKIKQVYRMERPWGYFRLGIQVSEEVTFKLRVE